MRRLPTEGWVLLCVVVATALLPRAVPEVSPQDIGRLTISGLAPGASREEVRRVWRIRDVPVVGDVAYSADNAVATMDGGKVVALVGHGVEKDGIPILGSAHEIVTTNDVCRVLGSCDRYEGGGFFSSEPRIMVFTRYDLRVKYNLKHMVMEYRLGSPPQ